MTSFENKHLIQGAASAAGTLAFRNLVTSESWCTYQLQDLLVSSVAHGTYKGQPSDEIDLRYEEALLCSLSSGINVFDTAINYRCQRSERTIGRFLRKAIETNLIKRDEVIIVTKGGFVPFDGAPPKNVQEYIKQVFVKTNLIDPADLSYSLNCLSPSFLKSQILCSRENLQVETIDLYLLHNPEIHLGKYSSKDFYKKISCVFEVFEEAVEKNWIKQYGISTWNGFRYNNGLKNVVLLKELLKAAKEAGGLKNHFSAIQLPYSLKMPEAYLLKNQSFNNESKSILDAANSHGIFVMASSPLCGGKLVKNRITSRNQNINPLAITSVQTALQFVRSTEGVGTAVFGTYSKHHTIENASVISLPIIDSDTIQNTLNKIAFLKADKF